MEQLETLSSLIEAIQNRAWYPVFGLAFTLVIALYRRVRPEVWDMLPTALKPVPAITFSFLQAFVVSFDGGLSWTQALAVGIYTAVGSTLVAVGFADTASRMTGARDARRESMKPEAKKPALELNLACNITNRDLPGTTFIAWGSQYPSKDVASLELPTGTLQKLEPFASAEEPCTITIRFG